jgi:hypothetical protein
LVIVFLAVLYTILVASGDRAGVFDPPPVRPIADQRLLTNVRDELADRSLLDAVFHAPEGRVYVTQQGGTIHRYDPATGLWSSENPFTAQDFSQPDFEFLRSGCGADPASDRITGCPDPKSLWALSISGGLARRTAEGWGVVVGDTAFVGVSGIPVEDVALTTAAISKDNRWLVLGTQHDGIGIYDNQRHTWLRLEQDLLKVLPSFSVTHLTWAKDRFWIGGPDGMTTLDLSRSVPHLSTVTDVQGQILDLEADTDGGLWVLQRKACADGGVNCLWMGRFQDADHPPQVLLDERQLFPNLTLADLTFAQYWQNRLTVAGRAGIFTYDAVRHAWERRFDKAVAATLALPDGTGFYFGYSGGVGLLTAAGVKTWELPGQGQRVAKVLSGTGSEILALTESGNVFSITPSGPVTPTVVFESASTALDPERFSAAVAFTDTVLFLGPDGALLHDTAQRTYRDIGSAGVPKWLADPATRFVNTASYVYAVAPAVAGQVSIYALAIDRLADPGFFGREIASVKPTTFLEPASRIWKWDAQSMGLLAGDGSAYKLGPQGRERATGEAVTEMDRLTFRDVAALDQDLVVATDRGLRRYDGQTHTWGSFFDPAGGGQPVELAAWSDRLLVRTVRVDRSAPGRLAQAGGNAPQVLIGDEQGFEISDSGLSDVRRADQAFYLAGEGRVERYDAATRRVSDRWNLGTTGAVELKAILKDQPLALFDRQAFLGKTVLDAQAGAVITLSADDKYIWTVRDDGKNRYLKGYPIGTGDARCFFRRPAAGEGTSQVLDARAVPGQGGLLAVATDAGLRFYDPAARSWLNGPSDLKGVGGRLYTLGDHLLFVQEYDGALHLSLMPISSLGLPGSCSDSPVTVQSKKVNAAAIAVDEASGRLAWVAQDGAVLEWQPGGQESVLLNTAGQGPAPADLRRVFSRSTCLLFTTDEAIWRYDLSKRFWTRLTLRFQPSVGPLADMNIERQGDQEFVVARTQAGEFYLGSLSISATTVTLERIHVPPATTFGATADALLDVQKRDDRYWTFVLTDRIKYYDPAQRQWLTDVQLGGRDPSLWYGRVGDRAVAVGQSGGIWWVAQEQGPNPTHFAPYTLRTGETTAVDETGMIWRLMSDGRLLKCQAPFDREAACALQGEPPFYVVPGDLLRVFTWRDVIVFGARDGLRAYAPASGRVVTLPPEAAGFSGASAARKYGEQIWLQRPENGDLLILSQSSGPAITGKLIKDVRELVYDATGLPWARFDDGWRVWRGGEFVEPALAASGATRPGGLRLYAGEGVTTSGLDAQRQLYWWQDHLVREKAALPSDIAPANVAWLLRAADGEWWVRAGDTLQRAIRRDDCPIPPSVQATAPLTATVQMTGTLAAPTPSATIQATATLPALSPAVTTCLTFSGSVNLPTDLVIWQARPSTNGALDLWGQDGRAWRVERDATSQYQLVVRNESIPRPQGIIEDDPKLRSPIRQLPSGQWAYDPITALRVNQDGGLLAERQGGSVKLAGRGALQPDRAPGLDAGWLKWDGRNFVVTTPTGPQAFAPQDFIIEERLLFETADAILAESDKSLYLANRYGIWKHTKSTLGLDDTTITFRPMRLTQPITAAHGRFLTAAGELALASDRLQPVNPALFLSLGDVTITERVVERRIEASVAVVGATTAALGNGGFLWDVNRRGVAYDGQTLVLQSDAGIGPINRLAGFDPGPIVGGQLRCCEAGTSPLVVVGSVWYRRSANNWTALPGDPAADRPLVDKDNRWTWTLHGGRLSITLSGQPFGFTAGPGRVGFGFGSDRLLAAAAHDGRLHVMTEAFWEMATQPDDLAAFTATRQAPLTADALDVLSVADGSFALFRLDKGAVTRWDAQGRQFVSVGSTDNPYEQRLLAETERLRFTWRHDRVVKELKVDGPAGQGSWVAFDLTARQFPFDAMTALAVYGDQLYVGSAAGLQVYRQSGVLGLRDLIALYDMRGPGGATLVPVERVGSPSADPTLLMARSARLCLERRSGSNFVPSREPAALDWRLRAQTDLWQWSGGPNGETEGRYRDNQKQLAPTPLTMASGRFPHDDLQDVAVCAGHAATLWKAGWITVLPDSTLRLAAGLRNYAMAGFSPRQFICVEHDVPLARSTLAAGLYLEGSERRVRYLSGGAWSDVTDTEATASLLERVDRPPIQERGRLRLLARGGPAGLVFEQRSAAGQWLPLVWQSRSDLVGGWQVAVDRWQELLQLDGRLWAATPVGLVSFGRDFAGRAMLNPDDVMVVREPTEAKVVCPISDLAADPAGGVRVRCAADSAKVFEGRLDGKQDADVFRQSAGADPFAGRELVNRETDGKWVWRLVGRQLGQSGYLTTTLNGAVVELAGGRFTFDAVNSIALWQPEELEIGTESGGWFQTPTDNLDKPSALSVQRPKAVKADPSNVTRVGITRQADQMHLCLRDQAGVYTRLGLKGEAEQAASCSEYLGDDGMWRYAQEAGLLTITTAPDRSVGGLGTRRLETGRFVDDVAVGLPTAMKEGDRVAYLLPTQAGVLQLDGDLKRTAIHVPPFPGLPADSVPTSVLMLDPSEPVYASQDALRRLGRTRAVVVSLAPGLPDDVRLRVVEDGPATTIRLRWDRAGVRGWGLLDRRTGDVLLDNGLPVDVSGFDKYSAGRLAWGDLTPWLQLNFAQEFVAAARPAAAQSYQIDLPTGFELLAPIVFRERLLLFGRHELLEVNLERMMVEAFNLSLTPTTMPPSPTATPSASQAATSAAEAAARVQPSVPPQASAAAPTTVPVTPTAVWTATAPPTLPPTAVPSSTPTVTPVPTVAPYGLVKTDQTNLRAGPGTNYRVLGQVSAGARVALTGTIPDRNWWQVRLSDGMTGWLNADLVNTGGCLSCVPLVTPPPTPEPTPTPRPSPTSPPTPTVVRRIASNRTDFGGQGVGGWSYLMESARQSGNWREMRFDGQCYRTDNWEKDVRICPEGEVHPGQSTRVAYQWRPSFSGNIKVTVHAHKADTGGGDGVWVGTFRARDGVGMEAKLGEFRIGGGDNTGRTETYSVTVDPGNMIYVIVDIGGESTYDKTRVYIDIN